MKVSRYRNTLTLNWATENGWQGWWEVTHKNPKQRTAESNNFCFKGRCKDFIAGNGKIKTQKSVVMLNPAAMYHIVKLSKQRLARLGTKRDTGMQAKTAKTDWITFQMHAKKIRASDARRRITPLKTRRYCSSRAILTMQSDQTYSWIAPKRACKKNPSACA